MTCDLTYSSNEFLLPSHMNDRLSKKLLCHRLFPQKYLYFYLHLYLMIIVFSHLLLSDFMAQLKLAKKSIVLSHSSDLLNVNDGVYLWKLKVGSILQ